VNDPSTSTGGAASDAPAAIRVAGVGKRYVKYEDTPMLLSRALRNRSRRSELWALRDTSFEMARGECVGIIGRNGSGKSTLLRMLAGVTAPTEGVVEVNGLVAPLIAVGVGFHPELTGRENVYVNGRILGMHADDVTRRFDEILDFSEVGSFIDTPVKFYSSGMFVRLGFAVAIVADPDILLVDEVLAVGDIAFQMKCFDRMDQIRDQGATVVVVSHALNSIRSLCERTLVFDKGSLRHDGPTEDGIALFHELMGEEREPDGRPIRGQLPLDERAVLFDVELVDEDGRPTRSLHYGQRGRLRGIAEFIQPVERPIVGALITGPRGELVSSFSTPWIGGDGSYAPGDRVAIDIGFDVRFGTGSYRIQLNLVAENAAAALARPVRALDFFANGRRYRSGLVDLDPTIEIRPEALPLEGAPTSTD
jgi:ABC-type polysaccharide/polyol phosphate transport system ATPase subunit